MLLLIFEDPHHHIHSQKESESAHDLQHDGHEFAAQRLMEQTLVYESSVHRAHSTLRRAFHG